jgi:hypothetical protein
VPSSTAARRDRSCADITAARASSDQIANAGSILTTVFARERNNLISFHPEPTQISTKDWPATATSSTAARNNSSAPRQVTQLARPVT